MRTPCVDSSDDEQAGAGRAGADALAITFFHDGPTAALALAGTRPDQPRQAWLVGAALGALGRFGSAAGVLRPVADAGAGVYSSLAFSTLASHQRQLGRHADALACDQRASALIPAGEDPAGINGAARFDAGLGLAADAVGLGRVDEAVARLAEVAALAVAADSSDRAPAEAADPVAANWRRRVRVGWVATEIALLRNDPVAAMGLAEAALDEAVKAEAPRHIAKCALFLGASRYVHCRNFEGGRGIGEELFPENEKRKRAAEALRSLRAAEALRSLRAAEALRSLRAAEALRSLRAAEALRSLRAAAEAAAKVGALPLRWVADSLLADLLEGRAAAVHLTAAATVITAIGRDLPAGQRAAWLERPDLRTLLDAAARDGA